MATGGIRAPGRPVRRPIARRATLDGALIERGLIWWRELSPRGRRGWLGAALALLTLAGAWSVSTAFHLSPLISKSQTHARTPTSGAMPGSWLVGLLGIGAYPTLGICFALGALWLAEGLARRRLAGRWLTFALLALWLTQELCGALLFGPTGGGAVGSVLAMTLADFPAGARWLAELLVALVGLALALVIGGTIAGLLADGLTTLPHALRQALRSLSGWLHGSSHATHATSLASNAHPPQRAEQDQQVYRAQTQRSPAARQPNGQAAPAPRVHVAQSTMQPASRQRAPDDVLSRVVAPAQATPFTSFGVPASLSGETAKAHPQPKTPHLSRQEQASRLAQVIWQALHDRGAVTEVFPLEPVRSPLRLCVRPVERFKRDAQGRVMTDHLGRPILVRTRISRILRLRDTLSQTLNLPGLHMTASEDNANDIPEVESRSGPYVIIEIV
ncbi:MAG TPA: hypothetical protein VKQ36_11730 [Ktedonobacterales bacterium]|nr:hypothetical protein [Ktedonobacterales bacterium]